MSRLGSNDAADTLNWCQSAYALTEIQKNSAIGDV